MIFLFSVLTCQLHGAYDSLRSSFSSFWKQKFSPSTQRRADAKATTDSLQQPGAPCDDPSAAVAITPTAAISLEGEADPRADAGASDAASGLGKAGAGAAESAQDDGDSAGPAAAGADEKSDGAAALDPELIPDTALSADAESVVAGPGAELVGAAAAAEPVFVEHEGGPEAESP